MKNFLTFVLIVLFAQSVYSQDYKRPETYNYLRGMEALENGNREEALEYFNKDIKENPQSGYPYSWVAMLRSYYKEYGKALTASNMAIKYLPKKDVEFLAAAYAGRANVYLYLEDTVKAINDYTLAIKTRPDNTNYYEERAQVYYEQKKYDLADADYRKMIEIKPGDVMGYMGLGRNANKQKQWLEAIKQFDYVEKLSSDYSSVYAFRAESYIGLEKWNEATDDIVNAMAIEWDQKAMYLIAELKEPALSMLYAKLKVKIAKHPNDALWPYILAGAYEQNKQYGKAIEYYTLSNEKVASPVTVYRISRCQFDQGDYASSLSSIDRAIEMDTTDLDYSIMKADILYYMGDINSSIQEWNKILAQEPEYDWGYYRRGWYKSLAGNYEDAVEDMTMSIVLDPTYAYAYMSRGDIYRKLGKTDLAEADFKKAIELEDSPEKYTCIFYAYQGLGQYDKAVETLNAYIAENPDEPGTYYEAACVYSRMENKEEALKYLKKSFEMGYNKFNHLDYDHDMDFLRDSKEYKELLKQYRDKTPVKGSSSEKYTSSKEPVVTEIPFTKEAGVTKVKCQINGLPLHFVFDTGASDVTISMVEATFMMKNGYLDRKDVIGSQRYMDANGDVTVGTVINLKSVQFGGLNLENVRASVVRNQKAPLLLGQSVLSRLGKIEIDNGKRVIKITH